MATVSGNTQREGSTMDSSLGRCLVDGDAAMAAFNRRLRGKSLGISLAIETAVVALLIIAPLLTSVAQPSFSKTRLLQYFVGALGPQTMAQRPVAAIHSSSSKIFRGVTYPVPRAPVRPAAATDEGSANAAPGPELVAAGIDSGDLGIGVLPRARPAEPPREEVKASDAKPPVRLSESVVQARLISRIEPRYPAIALQTRLQGTVRLSAIIGRDGRIDSLGVVSGHPLFVQAALDAVRQWRYRPTLLNGEPVEVETWITVNFRLAD